jgi:hypothetical protein
MLSKNFGGQVMRIPSERNNLKDTNLSVQKHPFEEENGVNHGRKFNISVEKKIEKLWLDAKDLGWSFQEFVVFILEILTIMHYRKSVAHEPRSTTRRKRHAA